VFVGHTTPGFSVTWSRGAPSSGTGATVGACHGRWLINPCAGVSRQNRSWSPSIGAGTRGPWAGVYGQRVYRRRLPRWMS
jgi:hypothetical protein